MSKKTQIFLSLLLGGLLVFAIGCDDDDKGTTPVGQANIRVIHTSYDAPNVDVSVDGTVAISGLGYGEASPYAAVDAGIRNIVVTPTGQVAPEVINADLTFDDTKEYTIFAVDALASISAVVEEDDRTLVSDKAKIRFLHASPDAPAVDIKLNSGDGATVFGNRAFESITSYASVDAGSYSFVVTAAGSTNELLFLEPVSVIDNTLYTVVAHGTLDATDSYPFAVRIFVDNNTGDAFVDLPFETSNVMVVHASPDEVNGVDLLVDNAIVGTALTFTNNTGYFPVLSGQRNVKINATGTSTTVLEENPILDVDVNYTVFAANVVASIETVVLTDDLSAPASGKAHVRFVHLSPDAPTVDITTDAGATVFDNIAFKGSTAFTPLDAGTYSLEVRDESGTTTVLALGDITFTNGKIYTVFARGLVSGVGNQALGATIIENN